MMVPVTHRGRSHSPHLPVQVDGAVILRFVNVEIKLRS